MVKSGLKVHLALVAILSAIPACANAGDAGRAWGTIESPGQQFFNSAETAEVGGTIAQQVAAGQAGGSFKNVTSCGTCTTISITGNQNSVSGNSITSTNSGTVSSTGIFNFDGP